MHMRKNGANRVARLAATTAILATLMVAAMLAGGGQLAQVAHAAPAAATHKLDAATLQGGQSTLKQSILDKPQNRGMFQRSGAPLTAATTVTDSTPIIFVYGIWNASGNGTCTGNGGTWTNTISYLGRSHPGFNGNSIKETGSRYPISYYNNTQSKGCIQITYGYDACEGYPSGYYRSDSREGTTDEPLEHVACDLAWYIYTGFTEVNQNVYIVAHSMGGLIVRYAIEKTEESDTHFPPRLYVSDVVSFSSPYSGLTGLQLAGSDFQCGACYQSYEMGQSSSFINALNAISYPTAYYLTNWTMMGSLSGSDPVDWDYQATHLSNYPGEDNNHRIGYDNVPKCTGQPGWPTGYGHGDYMNDQCDGYDAHYYYCDECSQDQHTNFNHSTASPHSLHDMMFSFFYTGW